MWRIAFMSLAILGIALGACAQEVQIAKPVTGDYEVVALAYRGEQDCEQESEAFEHALSIADLRPREVLPSVS